MTEAAHLTAARVLPLAGEMTRQLASEAPGAFHRIGEGSLRAATDGLLRALSEDTDDARAEALRAFLSQWIPEQIALGMTLHEMRRLCLAVRRSLLDSLGPDRALDDWLDELTYSSALFFVIQRDSRISDQAALLEMQLAELRGVQQAQQRTLEILGQIGIPIAPIHEGILVVPLMGVLESQRAALLMSRLLERIVATRERFVLVDVSGVPALDATIVTYLSQMAQATRLLGAELMLVGISPGIARTIVQLGLDLSALRTEATLRDGLGVALRLLGLQVSRLDARVA